MQPKKLGVSEGQLLATQIGTEVTVLEPKIQEILGLIESLGFVMALTRNESVVHERKGVYQNFKFNPHASLFVGKDIDLRLFTKSWKFVFAVQQPTGNTTRKSIQFFDNHGMAVHKIYLTEKSNENAFDALVDSFKLDDQISEIEVDIVPPSKQYVPQYPEDLKSFHDDWLALKDTHQFFGLLRKHKLDRLSALAHAPSDYYAKKYSNDTLRNVLFYCC